MKLTSTALILAEILFLWMFLAAEPLELMADGEMLAGLDQVTLRDTAYAFSARWRHGMSGNSPIYMPGFFAVAVTVWFWAIGKDVRRMISEGASLTFISLLAALLIQPMGTSIVMQQFQEDFAVVATGALPSNTLLGVFRAVFTLATFAIGIISLQKVLVLRSAFPLVLPAAMNVVLALIRPWTVADFTGFWWNGILQYNLVAHISALSAIICGAVMFHAQRISASTFRKEAAGSCDSSEPREQQPNTLQ